MCVWYDEGMDNTGDVTNNENIQDFRRQVMKDTNNQGVHVFIADGGFSVTSRENYQVYPIHLTIPPSAHTHEHIYALNSSLVPLITLDSPDNLLYLGISISSVDSVPVSHGSMCLEKRRGFHRQNIRLFSPIHSRAAVDHESPFHQVFSSKTPSEPPSQLREIHSM